jgi:hypothetical protein
MRLPLSDAAIAVLSVVDEENSAIAIDFPKQIFQSHRVHNSRLQVRWSPPSLAITASQLGAWQLFRVLLWFLYSLWPTVINLKTADRDDKR